MRILPFHTFRITSLVLAAVVGACAIAAFAVSAEPANAEWGCWPNGAKTFKVNAQIRVFRLTRDAENAGRHFYEDNYVGCAFASGKWWSLYSDEWGGEPTLTRIAGSYVAMFGEYSSASFGDTQDELFVLNLATGKMVYNRVGGDYAGTFLEAYDLELGPNGVAAFIVEYGEAGSSRSAHRRRVSTVGPNHERGREYVLDRGMKIRSRSLSLRGQTLYWKKGNKRYHAPFR